ncbi:hypothetical protein [Oenococcus oeni]|uniref:Uncharacterized protein n=4 Tax=Oenococcus oeni TaxID=1247 RepID=Q04HI4_OENOB|nr:hypothetical protein [Oenococcus oeni]ABJ56088.1 hypothetical protein OEOE_0086 [Oenococcus oeni PSU-1]AWW98708.1 hypothetical protein C5H79_03945 [Oenococcus oeni]KEP88541.1 hypothetical protein X279_00805 [Oenococcus oeni IOEB_0501]KMQ37535.1 hypothetical protein AAX19_08775 [Oenococcus oeni]MDQ8695891.1 hypothetical protein [Oenococcus oeni]
MTNKRTWRFLYDAILYPILNIVAAIILIMTTRITQFTAAEKSIIITVIIVVLTIETIFMVYRFLKKDGFIVNKASGSN